MGTTFVNKSQQTKDNQALFLRGVEDVGFRVVHSDGDANLLIVQTAVQVAKRQDTVEKLGPGIHVNDIPSLK